MLDPESKDMYHCHPHHFLEIFKIQVNEPIRSYQIQHLKHLNLSKKFLGPNLTYTRFCARVSNAEDRPAHTGKEPSEHGNLGLYMEPTILMLT